MSYGLTFIALALFFFIKSSFGINQILVTLFVLLWGIRITSYLFRRILKTGKDKRFDDFRHNLLKFGSFWFFQAITVWIIMVPAVIVLNTKSNLSLNLFSILGILIWILGFCVETISDQQKFVFKSDPKNSAKWVSIGLWKYSRHPNYLGEMLCWWGILVFAIPYLSNFLFFSIISPTFITFILIFVSGTPPLEKRYDEKYKNNKEYQEYKRKTSILIPYL